MLCQFENFMSITVKGLKQVYNIPYYSFINADRRHKNPRSETFCY